MVFSGVLCTWISLVWLISSVLSIRLNTGKGYLFSKPQVVDAGYININDDVSVYYQYYESPNGTIANKNLIFYFGNFLASSAIVEAAFGVIPYFMIRDKSSKSGVRLEYNPWSVNQYASVVVADIVRGNGFSQCNNSNSMDYKTIAQDMDQFVEAYLLQTQRSDFQFKNLIMLAGYQMAVPALTYMNITKQNMRLVISNGWFGYATIDQLHILLPSFGFTDRIKLDKISNQIYSLQVNDYSKDIDEMFGEMKDILAVLDDRSFLDFNNPMLDQSQVYQIRAGVEYFYGECVECRVYVTVYKDNWKANATLLEMMKKDLIKDARQTLFDTASHLGRGKNEGKWNKNVMMIEGGNCPKTNTQCFEEVSTRNFIVDNSFIYSLVGISKYYLQIDDITRLDIEECRTCGFYSLLENWSGASTLISLYEYIYNETNVKSIENEYKYRVTQMISTSLNYFSSKQLLP